MLQSVIERSQGKSSKDEAGYGNYGGMLPTGLPSHPGFLIQSESSAWGGASGSVPGPPASIINHNNPQRHASNPANSSLYDPT